MLTIHQARLQQHINLEIAVVPTGVRKDRNQRSNWQHPLDHGKSKIFLSIYLYLYLDLDLDIDRYIFCFIDYDKSPLCGS